MHREMMPTAKAIELLDPLRQAPLFLKPRSVQNLARTT